MDVGIPIAVAVSALTAAGRLAAQRSRGAGSGRSSCRRRKRLGTRMRRHAADPMSAGDDASADATTSVQLARALEALPKQGYGVRFFRLRKPLFPGVDPFIESGGAAALLACAGLLSLLLANHQLTQELWLSFWATRVGFVFDAGRWATNFVLSLKGWVNEGMMAIFFFLVGLEIKKEAIVGCLSTPRSAALPCLAALGGMVVPMLFYLAANLALPGGSLAGWATPMATDIAFALGVLGLFGQRMPTAASAFLLALATVDDLGAIFVIGTCFVQRLRVAFLVVSLALCLLLWRMSKERQLRTRYFVAVGTCLWAALLAAGLSAEVAGCLTAAAIPTGPDPGDLPPGSALPQPEVEQSSTASDALTHRIDGLIGRLSPFVNLFVLPAFALANLAVPVLAGNAVAPTAVGGSGAWAALTPALGLSLGLAVGKPLGIFAASWLAVRSGIGELPEGLSNRHVGILSVLGGIGFTMCLFLVDRSLPLQSQSAARLAVVISSLAMSAAAAALMRALPPARLDVDASKP
eukprot:TRINITY_DN29236_c0_g4_i1.p1 TRINITY_DN29236_c0_g4~~TRINITY_DN29236_c0_g4_i1.p1  ORF type:complete len:582 (-),score=126.15 TRINITY_DN29236_c0_g4_i1:110-1675(-)